MARPRAQGLSRRRRAHHPVAGASGAAPGREDQPRAGARRRCRASARTRCSSRSSMPSARGTVRRSRRSDLLGRFNGFLKIGHPAGQRGARSRRVQSLRLLRAPEGLHRSAARRAAGRREAPARIHDPQLLRPRHHHQSPSRRHLSAGRRPPPLRGWSTLTKDDFVADYWQRLWGWYDAGGLAPRRGLSRRARPLRLRPQGATAQDRRPSGTSSTPAARPRTPSSPTCSTSSSNPDAVTLAQIRTEADAILDEWLTDRRNRRVISFRLEACGYVSVRNPDDHSDGRWRIRGARVVVYARSQLPPLERLRAARELVQAGR